MPEIKECAEKEIVLDTAIYDEKVYAKRINHNDGAYIDMAACTRKDAPGVVVTYYYTSAEYATNYTLTIQSLLNGYRKDRDGTIIVADEGVIIASNNTGLIGQSTTDYEVIQKLKNHADSRHMMGLTINGVRCHGVMLKQRDHYIYAYVPDSIIFQTLLQNVIMCLFIYLIVVALIWMIYRKSQKNTLIIEKEKNRSIKKPDEREIKVEHKTPEIIHKDLIGSPIHLKRLLMNILSNAVKYNKDYGKIYLSAREIPSDQDGIVTFEFTCQDTGIGMSEEFQKHLFELFAQEQKGGASKFGGTGLGMPIDMKLLVEIIAELAGKNKNREDKG